LDNSLIGRLVISKAGRDKDKLFLIAGIIDVSYVIIVDGDLRKIESAKKKKLKHLLLTEKYSAEIKEMLIKGDKVGNAQIRKYIQSEDLNREV